MVTVWSYIAPWYQHENCSSCTMVWSSVLLIVMASSMQWSLDVSCYVTHTHRQKDAGYCVSFCWSIHTQKKKENRKALNLEGITSNYNPLLENCDMKIKYMLMFFEMYQKIFTQWLNVFQFCSPETLLKFSRETEASILCSIWSSSSNLCFSWGMKSENTANGIWWLADSNTKAWLIHAAVTRHVLTRPWIPETKHLERVSMNDFLPLPMRTRVTSFSHFSFCFASSSWNR